MATRSLRADATSSVVAKKYPLQRPFDLLLASFGLLLALPALAVSALGIRLSSPGPVLYRADRAGVGGHRFPMLKLRTMHCSEDGGSRITAGSDRRVFWFGSFLRRFKLDELPQLLNIILGDMSVVGPRPEDVGIVEESYTEFDHLSLMVRPGLTSPGSIWYYTQAESLIPDDRAEEFYVTELLHRKLAVDIDYLQRRSLRGDIEVVVQTVRIIAHKLTERL